MAASAFFSSPLIRRITFELFPRVCEILYGEPSSEESIKFYAEQQGSPFNANMLLQRARNGEYYNEIRLGEAETATIEEAYERVRDGKLGEKTSHPDTIKPNSNQPPCDEHLMVIMKEDTQPLRDCDHSPIEISALVEE